MGDSYFLVFLRHGESEGNARGYFQGQADFPLTEKGRSQSQALADFWKSNQTTFDTIISSPLMRARETAEIIASQLSPDSQDEIRMEFDPNWMERDFGRISGLAREEVEERFPRPDFISLYERIGETGESQWELYLRASRALQDILHQTPERYLIVSHGGILNMAMYAILGIAPQENFIGPRFQFQNTAYAQFTYKPSKGVWIVQGIGLNPQ
jgi:broad specificity phosphatase PhoE